EVDLSDEWASMLESGPATETAAPTAAQGSDIEFEIPAASAEEFVISDEPQTLPGASAGAAFEISAQPTDEETPVFEISAEPEAPKSSYELPSLELPAAPPPANAEKPSVPATPAKAPEPEFELEQDYELVLDPEPIVPAYDQRPPETPAAPPTPEPEPVAKNALPGNGLASDQFLADLANEIDSLGIGGLAPEFSEAEKHEPAAKPAAQPPSPVETGPLKEVFEEFRAELGEMGAEDEDLETHYNLGIAFREMGLLEEAISEFQKVAKARERGRPFRYSMQCYTLLGLSFMDKGQASIAALWYERALNLPGIEPESELALRYDLGVAQETAGEVEAALKSFTRVYANNIDYRDVGERIASLQKPAR